MDLTLLVMLVMMDLDLTMLMIFYAEILLGGISDFRSQNYEEENRFNNEIVYVLLFISDI